MRNTNKFKIAGFFFVLISIAGLSAGQTPESKSLLRSDWTVYRGGALVFNGAEDCSITDCELDQKETYFSNYQGSKSDKNIH